MSDAITRASIETARELTIQEDVRRNDDYGGIWLVRNMARAGLSVPAWWSPSRDHELRRFWKSSDHLAGAIYTFQAKMTAIPNRVIARDQSNPLHVSEAKRETDRLHGAAQFGEGWEAFFARWVEDLISQDNGAFAEIIGEGPVDGPLIGRPVTVAHLDSARCQRTGNAEYPVIYTDLDGRMYKLHYTRVIFQAQMSSPIAEMYGVGFCGVSRCINVAQTLVDVLTFKQEKLGSRPHRAIIVPQGGLDPEDVRNAFQLAESEMDAQGLGRYSKIVVAGSSSLEEAALQVYELSQLPDGFDEQTSITLGMATIALGLGLDARELFPAMSAGATRADALLQHLKQRGKGPGQIIQIVEQLFNFKFLPQHLKLEFDFQDDAQDRQAAETRKIRADRRLQDTNSGSVSSRILREQMLVDGDLTREQFDRLELMDGRLSDGVSVLALFYTNDTQIKDMLDLGVSDPLDTESNDMEAILTLVRERQAEVNKILVNEKNEIVKGKAFKALMALIFLSKHYQDPEETTNTILGNNISQGAFVRNDPRVRGRGEDATPRPTEDIAGERGTEDKRDKNG